MELEDRGWEGFGVESPEETLAGKVKEERVVMVEFVESSALLCCDQPLPSDGGRGRKRGVVMWRGGKGCGHVEGKERGVVIRRVGTLFTNNN